MILLAAGRRRCFAHTAPFAQRAPLPLHPTGQSRSSSNATLPKYSTCQQTAPRLPPGPGPHAPPNGCSSLCLQRRCLLSCLPQTSQVKRSRSPPPAAARASIPLSTFWNPTHPASPVATLFFCLSKPVDMGPFLLLCEFPQLIADSLRLWRQMPAWYLAPHLAGPHPGQSCDRSEFRCAVCLVALHSIH